MLTRFSEDLAALQRAIRWGDGAALFDTFTRTRQIRRAIIDAVISATPAGPIWNGQVPAILPVPFSGSAGHYFTNWSQHESESIAVYGQANWHLSDATTINFGLRYSDETKDFAMVTDAFDPSGVSYAAGGTISYLNAQFAGILALGPVINMADSKADDKHEPSIWSLWTRAPDRRRLFNSSQPLLNGFLVAG